MRQNNIPRALIAYVAWRKNAAHEGAGSRERRTLGRPGSHRRGRVGATLERGGLAVRPSRGPPSALCANSGREGTTIALIDGAVERSHASLSGAHIEVIDRTRTASPVPREHATFIA